MFKRRETRIFIVLTAGIAILAVLQLNETFFIYGLGQFFLEFLFGCTVIYGLFRFSKDRRPVSFINKTKPLILASALIVFLYLLSYMIDTDGGKKRLMVGGFNHDLNFVHFQLFDDSKFKLLNSGPFGGTFYRGTYIFRNDTLALDNDRLKNLYPSLKLVLKKKDDGLKYFDPVDTTKSMYQLSIYKDYRAVKYQER